MATRPHGVCISRRTTKSNRVSIVDSPTLIHSEDADINARFVSIASCMPYLIQILLPLYDNAGNRFPEEAYTEVRSDLTDRFGGLTAYSRSPAEGLWARGVQTKIDDIVVFEVMVQALDRDWWRDYKQQLERLFRQDKLVLRAQSYEPI